MDAERWKRLSPLLDELFELDAQARAARIAQLRDEDAELADELEKLVVLESESEDFLADPLIAAPQGPQPDQALGPYRLMRLLGEGGMGQVWLAERADGLYQRRVALKLLRPGLAESNLRLRFNRERQILARLEHPHIARLLDAGIAEDGQPYLALEYVEGEPITDWCRAHAFDTEARVRLFLQVCQAVSHAHANLIVHRDLKPSNILVTPLHEVRLLDFGIAKLLDVADRVLDRTRTGLRTFTLHYAAPEQIRGEPVTTMTDIYSLGVVLYELLTDRKPYRLRRQTDAGWEEAILAGDVMRPSQALQKPLDDGYPVAHAKRRSREVAGDLDNIVMKALAQRPEQRYSSVEALSQDLLRSLDGRPVQARPQSFWYRTRKYVMRNRWALAAGGTITLVLIAALGIVTWQARQSMREASRAQAFQDLMLGLFENAGSARSGAPLDVRQLLSTGLRRGERELVQQPQALAELYGLVARLHTGLGDYAQAQDVMQRQARLFRRLDSVPDSLRIESATDHGRVLRALDRDADCIEAMQPWEALARREDEQLPIQVAEFYSQLGRCRQAVGDLASARSLFQRALQIRQLQARGKVLAIESLADLASARVTAGQADTALKEYREALDKLQGIAGMRHPLAIEILGRICQLELPREPRRAEQDCRQALSQAQTVHGEHHPLTTQSRRTLAAVLRSQWRLSEAEALMRSTLAEMEAAPPDLRSQLAADREALADILWQQGATEQALEYSQRALAARRIEGEPMALMTLLEQRGEWLHALARDKDARAAITEALAIRNTHMGSSDPGQANALRLLGMVEHALGDDVTAQTRLQDALRMAHAGYGPRAAISRSIELSRASSMDAAHTAQAQQSLDMLAALADDSDPELQGIGRLARAESAMRSCWGPLREAALDTFLVIETDLRLAMPEGSALLRRVEALHARCK